MLEGLSEEDRAAIQAAMAEMEMDDAEAREAGGEGAACIEGPAVVIATTTICWEDQHIMC
jgi:hypothetical protein